MRRREIWFDKLIKKYPKILDWINWLKKLTLPGFQSVPVYDVFNFFIQEIKKDTLSARAKAIAFSFFLALFPFIIFMFTLIPYIPLQDLKENIMITVQEILPDDSTFDFISVTIDDILEKERGGLLSLGFFLAFYFSTSGVIGIMDSFDKSLSIYRKRTFFQRQGIALKITGLLVLMFIISIGLLITGKDFIGWIMNYFDLKGSVNSISINILRYVSIVLLFFYSISLIYYYAPATKKRWKFISLGSTVATLLSLLISLLYSYYVNNFASYNSFYGSIGAIMMLLIWIYLNAFVLLIGFELNSSIYYQKSQLKIKLEDSDNESVGI